jgi:hypothetical protein
MTVSDEQTAARQAVVNGLGDYVRRLHDLDRDYYELLRRAYEQGFKPGQVATILTRASTDAFIEDGERDGELGQGIGLLPYRWGANGIAKDTRRARGVPEGFILGNAPARRCSVRARPGAAYLRGEFRLAGVAQALLQSNWLSCA